MIQAPQPNLDLEEEVEPGPARSRWMALLRGLLWRELIVLLAPVLLPSQAQIGSAQGGTQRLMVGVVGGLVVGALLGLLLGLWWRGGPAGSIYRVIAAAVAVRIAFLGPIPLIVTVWTAAVAVAVADWLLVAASRRTARRAAAAARPPFEPVFIPGPPPPPVYPNRSRLRPGRPVVPWFVAALGLLAIGAIAWASHAGLPATAGPVSIPTPGTRQSPPPRAAPTPESAPTPGWSVCGRVRNSSVCVRGPITDPVSRRVRG